jgi:serine phosphatase RsbU (regulator of sigma subunit)
MSLRARLALAFFFLAVVPLAGVTLWSYVSTVRAFRTAVEAEGTAMAGEMGRRMDEVTRDLERRVEGLDQVPFADVLAQRPGPDDPAAVKIADQVRDRMGDAADFLESLEVLPAPPAAETAPDAIPPPAGPQPLPSPPSAGRVVRLAPPPPTPPGASPQPAGAAPGWVMKFEDVAKATEALGRRIEKEIEASERDTDRNEEAAEKARKAAEVARVATEMARSAVEAARQAGEGGRGRDAMIAMATKAATAATRMGLEAAHREFRLSLGRKGYTLRRHGVPVGTVKYQVRSDRVLAHVFAEARGRSGEIPFALDADGHLFAQDADRAKLEQLPLAAAGRGPIPEVRRLAGDWVVATRRDQDTGLTLGIARPVGEPLREIRRTALRNLGWGMGLVGVALVGILPVSRRLTRDLGLVTASAERLARGDLEARVPVRSHDELGRLAETFNRMAADLQVSQDRLVERERLRKELEMGRRIQEEMLPRDRLRVPFAEVKGLSIPAREVGGDFFNYFLLPDGQATLVVGDVSGKGVAAALLMANIQATLRARLPLESDLAKLAEHLDREIEANTTTTVYLTCFIGIIDGVRNTMRFVNAGHNPPLILRVDGSVEALEPTGRPLGLLPGGGYEERSLSFHDGESLVLYTDGLVDSESGSGEAFGLERLKSLVMRGGSAGIDGLLAAVEPTLREYRGGHEAEDDATLVVLRFGDVSPEPNAP